MERKYPKKFCVVKAEAELQEGPAFEDGFKGSRYWIGAEWDYIGNSLDFVPAFTPGWLYEIIGSCCPNRQELQDSLFWIRDNEIDALKAKADFVAEEGVTVGNDSWSTYGEEDQEYQEYLDSEGD
jgi:hypothetical protein